MRGSNEKKVERNTDLDISSKVRDRPNPVYQLVPHLAPKSPPYPSLVFATVTIDNVIVGDSAPVLRSSVMLGELLALTPHIHQPASLSSHHLSHVCLFSPFQTPGLAVSLLDHCSSP